MATMELDTPAQGAGTMALFAEVHDAVLEQVAGLLQLDGEPLRAAMAVLLDDLRQDFIAEERMLTALHSASAPGHLAEHANLLARLEIASAAGTAVCHQALRALPDWFRRHLDHWDALLAQDLGAAGGRAQAGAAEARPH